MASALNSCIYLHKKRSQLKSKKVFAEYTNTAVHCTSVLIDLDIQHTSRSVTCKKYYIIQACSF